MFIKTTTHKRIVAEKDEEIAGLMKRVASMGFCMAQDEDFIASLQSQLAPFTKIRNRDSRGRFIKDTVA